MDIRKAEKIADLIARRRELKTFFEGIQYFEDLGEYATISFDFSKANNTSYQGTGCAIVSVRTVLPILKEELDGIEREIQNS